MSMSKSISIDCQIREVKFADCVARLLHNRVTTQIWFDKFGAKTKETAPKRLLKIDDNAD